MEKKELTAEEKVEFTNRAKEAQDKINAILTESQLKMNIGMVPNVQFEDLKYAVTEKKTA